MVLNNIWNWKKKYLKTPMMTIQNKAHREEDWKFLHKPSMTLWDLKFDRHKRHILCDLLYVKFQTKWVYYFRKQIRVSLVLKQAERMDWKFLPEDSSKTMKNVQSWLLWIPANCPLRMGEFYWMYFILIQCF